MPVIVSGAVGPEGDGYRPATRLTVQEACAYHSTQIETLADAGADMAHAMTMTYVAEAIGAAQAASAANLPLAISFTVETDGALPDGTPLAEAVQHVDDATAGAPAYFGINCAHPTHFASVLVPDTEWSRRVRCARANASTQSHAELDEAETLDSGDPAALAASYADLRSRHPQLTILGGCCGTDVRHVRAIAAACL